MLHLPSSFFTGHFTALVFPVGNTNAGWGSLSTTFLDLKGSLFMFLKELSIKKIPVIIFSST